MSIRELARLFLRFQALLLLFPALYELTNIQNDYRAMMTPHLSAEADAMGARIFWMVVLRVGFEMLSAAVLLGKTDAVIDFLSGGARKTKDSAEKE